MELGHDWTASFRQTPSVREYILIGDYVGESSRRVCGGVYGRALLAEWTESFVLAGVAAQLDGERPWRGGPALVVRGKGPCLPLIRWFNG